MFGTLSLTMSDSIAGWKHGANLGLQSFHVLDEIPAQLFNFAARSQKDF
jgi:hypothetical protein